MIVLSINNLKKSFGAELILRDVSLTLQDTQRMGIVGPNGAGKTTLVRIITGELDCDSGSIAISRGMKCGYLMQEANTDITISVFEALKKVFEPVFKMEERLREIEVLMETAFEDEKLWKRLSNEYNDLTISFEDKGGYSWKSQIQGVMQGLKLEDEIKDQPVNTLSGGQRSRLALAILLLEKPELLLLDEPTNHLDTEAIQWLEGYLASWKGSVMIVSHDRWFLDRVCNRIGHMHHGIMDEYEGNYTQFKAKRAQRRRIHQMAYENNQREIKHHKDVIAQFIVWANSKGDGGKNYKKAQAREKMLERLPKVDKPETELERIHFALSTSKRGGKEVLVTRDVAMAFDNKKLFSNVDIGIIRQDKVALLGPNGVGKTTLLRIIAGELTPIVGDIVIGSGIEIGYYDQLQNGLNSDKTVMDQLWDRYPNMQMQSIRNNLGKFLFRGEDVTKKVSSLSGGEKGRLSLLTLMMGNDNFLLLDEPTNHLDIDSREKLEDALVKFEGTVLFVSHDRYFIDKVSSSIIEMKNNGVVQYEGNWSDYLKRHADTMIMDEKPVIAPINKTFAKKQRQSQQEKLNLRQELTEALEKVEVEILTLEERNDELTEYLSNSLALSEEQLKDYPKEYENNEKRIKELMDKWEQLSKQLDD